MKLLDPKPGQVVLDSVCGSGRLLATAATRCKNCHYVGIDIDEKIRITAFFYMTFHEFFDKYRKSGCYRYEPMRAVQSLP